MKTFEDLKFEPHSVFPGVQAREFFPNGYGVSVVRFKLRGDGPGSYGSFTDDETEWEMAVIEGTKDNWSITYLTPISDDVIGHLKANEVSEAMKRVQQLPPRSDSEKKE